MLQWVFIGHSNGYYHCDHLSSSRYWLLNLPDVRCMKQCLQSVGLVLNGHGRKNLLTHWILLRIRKFSNKSCRKSQTHFIFNVLFSRKSCHLWDDGKARQATDNNIIWQMCFVCWINKATDTHSDYVILIVFHSNNG